jgi:hypothetical protein
VSYAILVTSLAGAGIFGYGIVRLLRHRRRLPKSVEHAGELLLVATWLLLAARWLL